MNWDHPPARLAGRCRLFGGDDQAVHGRRPLSGAIGAAGQPGLSSESDASQASFGGIVRQTYPPILEEQGEARPALQDIVERLGKVVPTGESLMYT